MKKAYIEPSMEVIEINTAAIIAESMPFSETEVDTSEEGGQLGREDRPSGPNLWDNVW